MRLLRLLIASAALMFTAAGAYAAEPKQGVDYTVLDTPVRSEAQGKKVEVVEFFMFTCPHCYALEPRMSAWVKQNAEKSTSAVSTLPAVKKTRWHAHM